MIAILAPAKLNLGLELLGRRDDGFHEIRTVMTPVSLVDRLNVERSEEDRLNVGGIAMPVAVNIVSDALALGRQRLGGPALAVSLIKRIPLASGLGGGSSDAAATLVAIARLGGHDASLATLGPLARGLGSDVSFFLAGETAMVSGRGEAVTALPTHPTLHAVIAVPPTTILRKTALMYARITPDDFTDGAETVAVARDLTTLALRRGRFQNAFARPLYDHLPELSDLAREIEVATSLPANLSGAGPAHYVVCQDAEHASCMSRRVRTSLESAAVSVFAVRTISGIHAREGTHGARDA